MFRPIAAATVLGPFVALVIMVVYWDRLGLDGLILGTLVGAVASLGILTLATIAHRVAPLPHLVSRGLGLRALARHAAPLTLSRAILQVNLIVDRAVASVLLAGGVSALRFGDSIVKLPFGAIRPAYSTAIYPTLVQANRESEEAGLGTTTNRLLRYGLVFFVPLAGLTIAVAPLATALLYDRGTFSDSDLALTASIVALSAPLIVTWTVQPALVSALNAQRRGTVLLASGVITMVVNLVLNIVLGYLLGVPGIALATVIASFIVVAFMGYRLSLTEATLAPAMIWRTFFKSTLAILPSALLFGLPIWAGVVELDFSQQVVALVIVGVAGLTSYYGIARRLGLDEATSLVAFGTNTLRRIVRR